MRVHVWRGSFRRPPRSSRSSFTRIFEAGSALASCCSVCPFLVGGLWLVYALGYQLSVAVAVGFLALAGVATEFGVVMLLYLDQARGQTEHGVVPMSRFTHLRTLIRGASSRVRPKAMTVAVIVGGLAPVMVGEGLGSDVMKRIAAPLVGGMMTAPLLSLIVLPVVYEWWQRSRRVNDPEGHHAPRQPSAGV